jgi:hypothetical protein
MGSPGYMRRSSGDDVLGWAHIGHRAAIKLDLWGLALESFAPQRRISDASHVWNC